MGNSQPAAIELAGPGTLDVEAGRNLSFQSQRVQDSPETGIRTIGNSVDASAAPGQFGNPYLPIGGASVSVLFGVGPGIDQAAFINQYINPANAQALMPSSSAALIDFVDQYEAAAGNSAGAPQSVTQAWAIFQTLPAAQQKLLVEQVFMNVLDATGKDYNDPSSPFYHQYARGYQAIEALFPASLGYTAKRCEWGPMAPSPPCTLAILICVSLRCRPSRAATSRSSAPAVASWSAAPLQARRSIRPAKAS